MNADVYINMTLKLPRSENQSQGRVSPVGLSVVLQPATLPDPAHAEPTSQSGLLSPLVRHALILGWV